MEINFSKKYQNLFKLLNGNFYEVDTIIITGGRSSAKSFVVAVWSLIGLVKHKYNVLYTRFTNASIVDSVKPEVDDKIEMLNFENVVTSTNNHIEFQNNRIAFKGIKTGSKQQTANLKSLSGFNIFVVDEAEELPDYDTFEKVFLSIRSKEKRNLTILILNPTSIHHWIYRHFFLNRNIEGGFNGVHRNVMYVHTSYLDVPQQYIANNIKAYYNDLKENNPKKYEQIVLGGWTEAVEGRVFNNWKQITFKDYLNINSKEVYAIDWGKNHKMGIVKGKFDAYKNSFFVHELNYKSENELIAELNENERKLVNENEGGIIVYTCTKLGIPKDAIIVCDSAVPDNIFSLRKAGWGYAYGIDKPKGSVMAGISLLHNTNVFYTDSSKGIDYEFRNYAYANDRLGIVDDEVIKLNDDVIDPMRYLRRHFDKNK